MKKVVSLFSMAFCVYMGVLLVESYTRRPDPTIIIPFLFLFVVLSFSVSTFVLSLRRKDENEDDYLF